MAIPIKAQVNKVWTGNNKWTAAMILCDGSLYLTDSDAKVYAVDRTYFGQTMKEFMNWYLTKYNECRRRRNLLLKDYRFEEAETMKQLSESVEKTIVELKKVWKAFKSFSRKVKKNTNSNVVVNRMVVKTKQQIIEVNGLDIEQERPARNNRDKEIGSRKSGRRDENGRPRKL